MGRALTELAALSKLRNELPDHDECRAIRQRARVSAAEVAEAIGVTEAAVLTWERGTRNPRGENRDNYVNAIRVMRAGATAGEMIMRSDRRGP